jgi:hypothetical protein
MVREMEDRLKRGEPMIPRKNSAPKTAKRHSFCQKFKKNPYKFYSETPKVNYISYELNINKNTEIMSNFLSLFRQPKKTSKYVTCTEHS